MAGSTRRKTPLCTKPRVSRAFRVLSVAIAALCVGAQLSGLLHMLLVQHVVCPEHGELIHADERGKSDAHGGSVRVTSSDPAPIAIHAAPDSSESHADDHCLICAQPREPAALSGPVHGLMISVGSSVAPVASIDSVDSGRIPIYMLAPKNSPPV